MNVTRTFLLSSSGGRDVLLKVDAGIVEQYLQGRPSQQYSDSWVFHSIEDGQCLFEDPDQESALIISQMNEEIQRLLDPFVPYNSELWGALFPQAEKRLQNVVIHLVVGCPPPYDAMVRNGPNHCEAIIFDLFRLSRYTDAGHRVSEIIRKILTHECTHMLLHQDFPESEARTYQDKMDFLLYDEGLAHFLAINENVNHYDWNGSASQGRRRKAFHDFILAYKEEDPFRQKQKLTDGCTGSSWKKFACIAGMFLFADVYLSDRAQGLRRLYEQGWYGFSKQIS